MRLPTLISVLGFIILIIGTYCPMLRPFHLVNWNVYQLNQPFGFLLMLVGVIGVICAVLNQSKITKLSAFISLALVILLLIAAVLKVKTSFSFIPFKGINAFLTRQIAFKWGWYVLFAGPVLAVIGALFTRKPQISDYKQV
jgi:predicted membrane channel-forming protein YqfA (hemolysin III family)